MTDGALFEYQLLAEPLNSLSSAGHQPFKHVPLCEKEGLSKL